MKKDHQKVYNDKVKIMEEEIQDIKKQHSK